MIQKASWPRLRPVAAAATAAQRAARNTARGRRAMAPVFAAVVGWRVL